MAIEDAVALAECLSYPNTAATTSNSHSRSGSDSTPDSPSSSSFSTPPDGSSAINLPSRLRAYQQIRQPRAFAVQARSRFMGDRYLLPDGPLQEMRDKVLLGWNWDMDRVNVEADMQKYRYEWVDVTPTADSSAGEWDDWIVGFDSVDYVSSDLHLSSTLHRRGDAVT